MRCVIVTGAGASKELGKGKPLPLMHDWAESLRLELNAQEKGLAGAVGLQAGMSGEAFEETLGALLRFRDLRTLNHRFNGLGGDAVGKSVPALTRAHARQEERLNKIMAGINFTLFRLFGTGALDQAASTSTWRALFAALDAPDDLTVVTTNYDPSAEIALAGLGMKPDTGFDRLPGTAPILNPHGMVERARRGAGTVAVLHLHGAVGWYEQEGSVQEQHQNLDFNPTLGRPVVLYPDPDKDPTRDAVVQSLWEEFDTALEGATHVLVIGHSLRDDALVAKLRAISEESEVGVCVYLRNEPDNLASNDVDREEVDRIKNLLPAGVALMPANFAPGPQAIWSPIAHWAEQIRGEERAA